MIATLSFAALAGCGSKSISKNDETTISDTVKQIQKQTEKNTEATAKSTAKNDETTVSDTVKQTQKQTEKAADVITDAAKESKSARRLQQKPEAQKLKYLVMQLLQRNQQTKLLRQMSRLIN